jgi:uncharacterized protein (TIGR00725 family)
MRIAVIGDAAIDAANPLIYTAAQVGRLIAELGYILLAGACAGIPGIAEDAAFMYQGRTLGYSPADSPVAHLTLGLPARLLKPTLYTGRGFKGRNVEMVTAADAVIMLGGRFGTLNEAIIALEENRRVHIISNTAGAASLLPGIVAQLRPEYTNRYTVHSSLNTLQDTLALDYAHAKTAGSIN